MTRRAATPDQPRSVNLFRRLGLPQTPPPWSMNDVVLLIIVLFLAMLIVASGVAFAISSSPELISPFTLTFGWCVGAVLVIGYVLVSRRRTAQDRDAMRLERGLLPLPLMLLVGVAFGATSDVLAGLGSGSFGRIAELRGLVISDVGQLAIGALLVCVLLPIAHSLAFTGVILPALRVRLGAWAGILTTVVLFTVYHFLTFGSNLVGADRFWYGAFVPVITIFCLCAVRIRSASTRATIMSAIGAGVVSFVLMIAVQ